jgi:peptidoglycan/xylan/chitin deacetylase (PgdA/CDA1 family)
MDGAELAAVPMVLMYHSVARYDSDPLLVTVSPRRFAEQMRLLHRLGISGTSIPELLEPGQDGPAGARVGLTFDDGYGDFVTEVMPVLLRYQFTATVFVVAGGLGRDNFWDPAPHKPLMTADEVRRVADAGIDVGSHGLRHTRLRSLPAEALHREVRRSKEILQELVRRPVPGFCYPYGDLGVREVEAVRTAGYTYGCAVSCSELTGRYALPRTYIGDRDGAARLAAKWARYRVERHRLERHRLRRGRAAGHPPDRESAGAG